MRCVRDRHAAEQPVRQVEGAVLAAGLHGPAEVRDPAAAVSDGYTTLAEVYRYILETSKIELNIRKLKRTLKEPAEVIIVSARDYIEHCGNGRGHCGCGGP